MHISLLRIIDYQHPKLVKYLDTLTMRLRKKFLFLSPPMHSWNSRLLKPEVQKMYLE